MVPTRTGWGWGRTCPCTGLGSSAVVAAAPEGTGAVLAAKPRSAVC